MNKSFALRNKLLLFFLFVISLFIFIYLLYFLINGPRGIISYYKLKNYNNDTTKILLDLNSTNDSLLDNIGRLQINTLDLDFLDEKLRKTTGLVRKNEVIIVFDQ